jgi:hypothetical protein
MTGVAKGTVLKLLADIGQACAAYQDANIRGLTCRRVQCGEVLPSWLVGRRDADDARDLMHDLASRLTHRVQLTTDGHRAYFVAVEQTFGSDIDYAMLVKLYGRSHEAHAETQDSPVESGGT